MIFSGTLWGISTNLFKAVQHSFKQYFPGSTVTAVILTEQVQFFSLQESLISFFMSYLLFICMIFLEKKKKLFTLGITTHMSYIGHMITGQ